MSVLTKEYVTKMRQCLAIGVEESVIADLTKLFDSHEELRARVETLEKALRMAEPEVAHLEACEASADDGYGPRLRHLREGLIAIRAALSGEPKGGGA